MKILVISLAGIGDTLLATPLIRELRVRFPDAVIDALVLWAGSKDLIENNPNLNTVYQKNLMRESTSDVLRFLLPLRKERYDFSINTHPQSRIHYRLIAWLVGARTRISHEYECSSWIDRLLVNKTLPQDYTKHTVENNLALMAFLGSKPPRTEAGMEVFLSAAEEKWAEDFLKKHDLVGKKHLGIHVGSGGTKNLKFKRWPLENYIELIGRLNHERPDISVLLFGGPEEREAHEIILRQADAKLVFLAGTKNLRQAAALLRRCNGFLSVDTALMHLAAAVRTPSQIVIETPTLNATNLPYGRDFIVVPNPKVAGRQLSYYRYDGRGIQGTPEELIQCMKSVAVDAVLLKIMTTI